MAASMKLNHQLLQWKISTFQHLPDVSPASFHGRKASETDEVTYSNSCHHAVIKETLTVRHLKNLILSN